MAITSAEILALFENTFGQWKDFAQVVYYCVAIGVACFGLWTYRENSRRERAKWAVQLYEKFYETEQYKPVREKVDCASDTTDVVELVTQEPAAFTDYLNFFEMVAFLVGSGQLSEKDVLSLFHYYLRCLRRHDAVMSYLYEKNNGFEQLSDFLKRTGL